VKALDNPRSLAAVFLLAMLVSILIPHAYSSTLALTVFTTKPSYLIADDITVCGNLTYNGSPVPSWPVAIEVQDPLGTPVVTRTAQTNTSGTYVLTFKLPTNARLGTYAVYVSAGYKGETAANSAIFLIGPVHNIDSHLSYMTIQEAINAPETLNGHTIFVETGTYYEHVVVNKTVSLIGENRDSTIIDGNATGTVVYITVNSVTISSFTLQNSGVFPDSGIRLDSASNNSIVGNKITNNDLDCIWLFDSSSNYIYGNDIANYWNGIYLYASSSNTISGNNITADYGYGIGVRYSSNYNVISENRITNSGYGVYLDYSSNTNITGNNITANTDGIWLNPASDNCIFGNSITNNHECGAGLYSDSYNNSIFGNNITNNGDGIDVVSSNNNNIFGNNITDNLRGVWLESSSNNTVSRNNITGSGYEAVFLVGSSSNCIAENRITSNFKGIYLEDSSHNNSIVRNDILSNADVGIIFRNGPQFNSIIGNNITDNNEGIHIDWNSPCNTLIENKIANNNYYGIWLGISSNGIIHHNNLMNNTIQVYSYNSVNVWDNDYPSGGNFWSDYTDVDMYYGPYQNESGSDGIGDTPYVIDENNQDKYPLMKPYPWSSHDIGIAGITTSKTVVGQGFNLNINITIFNYGDGTETFNVTVYCNETAFTLPSGENYTTVTLASGESTTITFTWNTSGFAKGNYTISAYAGPLLGETDILDNNCTGSIVTVTIPGDVTGEGKCDMQDISLMIDWFMAKPPTWNPNCDVNNDLSIDMADISIAIDNFMLT
jgi:parallel beta-helix repeat protein